MATRRDRDRARATISRPTRRSVPRASSSSIARRQRDRKKATISRPTPDKMRAQLLEAIAGMGGGGGGRGGLRIGGGRGGGGGGRDDGPSAYEKWKIEQEKRRERELNLRKEALRNQLGEAYRTTGPQLGRFHRQANQRIRNAYAGNRRATAGINRELGGIFNDVYGAANRTRNDLRSDLAAQGGGGADMRALDAAFQQNVLGARSMRGAGQAYNRRLDQVMRGSEADARSTAAVTNQAAKSALQAAYQQQLAQVGMLGLV